MNLRLLHCVDERVTSAASEKIKRGGQGERLGGAHAQTRLLFSCFTGAPPLFSHFFKSVAGSETGPLSAAMLAQWLRSTLTDLVLFLSW